MLSFLRTKWFFISLSGLLGVLVSSYVVYPWVEGKLFSEAIAGRVAHVYDGDTIVVGQTTIRLIGITCDELGTRMGDFAAHATRDIAAGQFVGCRLQKNHSYHRRVGQCFMRDGRDLGRILIEEGYCGRCPKYDWRQEYTSAAANLKFSGTMPDYCRWF